VVGGVGEGEGAGCWCCRWGMVVQRGSEAARQRGSERRAVEVARLRGREGFGGHGAGTGREEDRAKAGTTR
jgi:hypothetical protein